MNFSVTSLSVIPREDGTWIYKTTTARRKDYLSGHGPASQQRNWVDGAIQKYVPPPQKKKKRRSPISACDGEM